MLIIKLHTIVLKYFFTKIEQYNIDNGSYPQKLQALVPGYIESIPPAKFYYMAKFHYYNHEGHAL